MVSIMAVILLTEPDKISIGQLTTFGLIFIWECTISWPAAVKDMALRNCS